MTSFVSEAFKIRFTNVNDVLILWKWFVKFLGDSDMFG